ncbi:MAG: zinc ribbon domain-containing protein [Planctomycetota bacterium]
MRRRPRREPSGRGDRLRHDGHDGIRNFCRVVGPLLCLVAFVFIVTGVVSFSRANDEFHESFGNFDMHSGNRERSPDRSWMVFVGSLLLMFGIFVTRFGFMGAAARYVAGEVAPVATDTVNYVARGTRGAVKEITSAVAEGLREGAGGESSVVVRCHKCNGENDADAKFCNECGEAISKTASCPECGELNDPDANFCDNCGERLGA